jgi:hypothetical protein
MSIPATPIATLLGLLTCHGLCQTSARAGPPANPLDNLVISGVPRVEPPNRVYQNFFDEVKDLGRLPLSLEAHTSLRPTDQELRSLRTVTADLATESRFFREEVRPLMFEARMQVAESGAVSPSLQEKLRDLENQWARTILDHVRQLKVALGEPCFQRLDKFVHSASHV